MGFWDVLDILESENRWFTAKEIMGTVDSSYNTVNKHLRKLVNLGFAVFEEQIKHIKNYRIPYNAYKAVKFLGKVTKNE